MMMIMMMMVMIMHCTARDARWSFNFEIFINFMNF